MNTLSRLSILTLIVAGLLAASARGADDLPSHGGAPSIPQCFIEDGQDRPNGPRYVMLGSELSLSVETGRMTWVLHGDGPDGAGHRSAVVVTPVGCAPVAPIAEERLPGIISHFRGEPSEWKTGLRTCRRLRYPQLWDGIDLVLEADDRTVKSTYEVAAGIDPSAVRLNYSGATQVTVDAAGRLVVSTKAGEFVDDAPTAWQVVDGATVDVPVRFALADASDAGVQVSFVVGEHDADLPLFLDPAVLVQAGFLGGTEDDEAFDVVVDASGNVYFCGWARSDETSFPVLVGPSLTWKGAASPWGDAFVAKLDPTGETLLYAGFIGGFDYEFANGLAVDSSGRAYVIGHTASDENEGFPVLGGPDLVAGGSLDGWIARVSASGASLEYCGYIGGDGFEDRALDVDVDALGRAYVVGRCSDDMNFPFIVGPGLSYGGANDCFVARIAANGGSFDYCGLVGGAGNEDCIAVQADGLGGCWIAGYTDSDETTFPVSGGPDQTHNGFSDGFVARVATDGSGLVWCGYLGGTSFENINDLAVDSTGAIYVAGATLSDETSFPVLIGPDLTFNGTTDGFITKISSDGSTVLWSGYLGGIWIDSIHGLAVDDLGGAWLSGSTSSTESDNFPVTGGPDSTANGLRDGFVARVLPAGTGLDFCGYVGGSGDDVLVRIATVPASLTPGAYREAWTVGRTSSDETTFPVISGPSVTQNGGNDAIVVRVQTAPDPWTDLGNGLAGSKGIPVNTGTGTLGPFSPVGLSLSNALENTSVFFVLGLSAINIPFQGGVLVPDLTLVQSFPTGPTGSVTLAGTWPTGVPAGFSIYVQWWVLDGGGPSGFAASNAIRGITP